MAIFMNLGVSDMEATKPFAIAAVLGIVSHHCFFKLVEVDTHPLIIAVSFLTAPFAVKYILNTYVQQYAQITTGSSILVVGCFIFSLWTSMLLYRAFSHPLNKFPGPLPAKLSKIWALVQTAKSGLKWYQVDAALHEEYGDYVRTGLPPKSSSITSAMLIMYLRPQGTFHHGSKSDFHLWVQFQDLQGALLCFNGGVGEHNQRQGIPQTETACLGFFVQVISQLEALTDTFIRRIRLSQGTPVIINEITSHYSYDVMTQLAFGESGGLVDGTSSDTAKDVLNGIQTAFDAIGLLSHVPWMMTLLTTFAFLPGPMRSVNDWSDQAVNRRKKKGSENPDFMGYLLKNTDDDKKGNNLLFAEARVLLVAGGDTTATALNEILILLAYYPAYIEAIRSELDPLFTESKFSCQTAYPILESVINETLRLYPPTLFGSSRVTPSEGLQIDNVFIPGDTVVYIPHYQLHRDPRNFVRPEEFLPERWTTNSDLILNRSAYIPFSMGPSNCPGKSLALMEIRSVVARTLNEFDVSFPAGATFDLSFFKGVKDHFVAGVPKQDLVFTKRVR